MKHLFLLTLLSASLITLQSASHSNQDDWTVVKKKERRSNSKLKPSPGPTYAMTLVLNHGTVQWRTTPRKPMVKEQPTQTVFSLSDHDFPALPSTHKNRMLSEEELKEFKKDLREIASSKTTIQHVAAKYKLPIERVEHALHLMKGR